MSNAYVFTVIGDMNGTEQVIYAQMATSKMKNEQPVAAEAIRSWIAENAPEVIANDEQLAEIANELAYDMRHDGVAWHNTEYGFCLTELVG